MGRKEILRNIIENSELHSLRDFISNSKMLQQTAFKGFRPQTLTKEEITRYLLRPAYVNDSVIYERFCDWWRYNNRELIDGLSEETERKWDSLINRCSAAKVRLAIVLSNLEDKEVLLTEFSELALKEITNAPNKAAAASDVMKHNNSKEIAKLQSKIDKLERRLVDTGKKNKSLSEQNKTLQADLALKSNRLQEIIVSQNELTEKVKILEKTNRDLARQIKLFKREAASRLTGLKVIQLDYLELGGDVEERKSSLSLFYDLLCSMEGMIVEIENRPSKWLDNANIKSFWKREGNRVHVLCRPVDHILINICMLMEDFLNDKGCRN